MRQIIFDITAAEYAEETFEKWPVSEQLDFTRELSMMSIEYHGSEKALRSDVTYRMLCARCGLLKEILTRAGAEDASFVIRGCDPQDPSVESVSSPVPVQS